MAPRTSTRRRAHPAALQAPGTGAATAQRSRTADRTTTRRNPPPTRRSDPRGDPRSGTPRLGDRTGIIDHKVHLTGTATAIVPTTQPAQRHPDTGQPLHQHHRDQHHRTGAAVLREKATPRVLAGERRPRLGHLLLDERVPHAGPHGTSTAPINHHGHQPRARRITQHQPPNRRRSTARASSTATTDPNSRRARSTTKSSPACAGSARGPTPEPPPLRRPRPLHRPPRTRPRRPTTRTHRQRPQTPKRQPPPQTPSSPPPPSPPNTTPGLVLTLCPLWSGWLRSIGVGVWRCERSVR